MRRQQGREGGDAGQPHDDQTADGAGPLTGGPSDQPVPSPVTEAHASRIRGSSHAWTMSTATFRHRKRSAIASMIAWSVG